MRASARGAAKRITANTCPIGVLPAKVRSNAADATASIGAVCARGAGAVTRG
jgi:hypothetical protein